MLLISQLSSDNFTDGLALSVTRANYSLNTYLYATITTFLKMGLPNCCLAKIIMSKGDELKSQGMLINPQHA
jgi:hypothetical protein